jgi:kelch-like protein 18
MVQAMHNQRADHVSVVASSRVYAIGGYNLNVAERYDPTTDSWTDIDNLLAPRGYAQGVSINNIIYVCGGWDRQSTVQSTCEKFDPSVGTWSSFASMPAARYKGMAMVNDAGTGFLIVGGSNSDDSIATTQYQYIISTNTWSTISALTGNSALARRWFSGFVSSGSIYVFGGQDGTNSLSSCYSVAISNGAITTLASMPYINQEYAGAFV